MKYKIYNEPLYAYECKAILTNILSGTSIKDTMEKHLEERGAQSMRSFVEPFFQKALEIEKHMKKNLPDYEDRKKAEFLFKKWEGADAPPIDAVYTYDLLLSGGIDSKAIAIFYTISGNPPVDIWGFKEIEAGTPPPFIDDGTFFGLINNSCLNQRDKLEALNLYYDFDSYHAYAQSLLQNAEEILKNKISEYSDDIKAHVDFIEGHLLANNAALLRDKVGIRIKDNILYDVYPSVYLADSLTMNVTGIFPPYVIVGISVFSLYELYKNTESDNSNAVRFIKCLSDNTKQTILQLLKKEALYGSQLAEKLNCTGANISQHMSALLSLNVVRIEKENNRVYFHLNKEEIHKHFEVAKGLFG